MPLNQVSNALCSISLEDPIKFHPFLPVLLTLNAPNSPIFANFLPLDLADLPDTLFSSIRPVKSAAENALGLAYTGKFFLCTIIKNCSVE